MWSLLIAKDFFSQFDRRQPARAGGRARSTATPSWRRADRKPAAALVRDFLGRPFELQGVEAVAECSTNKNELLQGTLDLLILRTLASGDMHGWGISQRLQQISNDVLQVNQGLSTRRSIGSSSTAGSRRRGETRKTTAARSSIR